MDVNTSRLSFRHSLLCEFVDVLRQRENHTNTQGHSNRIQIKSEGLQAGQVSDWKRVKLVMVVGGVMRKYECGRNDPPPVWSCLDVSSARVRQISQSPANCTCRAARFIPHLLLRCFGNQWPPSIVQRDRVGQ